MTGEMVSPEVGRLRGPDPRRWPGPESTTLVARCARQMLIPPRSIRAGGVDRPVCGPRDRRADADYLRPWQSLVQVTFCAEIDQALGIDVAMVDGASYSGVNTDPQPSAGEGGALMQHPCLMHPQWHT